MASVFSRIIAGELPARFVWKDHQCVAFLSIHPLRPGHTLVVPREEIDHWLDLPPPLLTHLTLVAQKIGRGLQLAFRPTKVGLMLAGLEVPHVHFHVVPIDTVHDLDFARQNLHPRPEELDASAQAIRTALRSLGFSGVAD
jgi:histidine triad (HIT) family protein